MNYAPLYEIYDSIPLKNHSSNQPVPISHVPNNMPHVPNQHVQNQVPNQPVPISHVQNHVPNHVPNQQVPISHVQNHVPNHVPNQQVPISHVQNQHITNQYITNQNVVPDQIPNQHVQNQHITNQHITNQVPNQHFQNRHNEIQRIPNRAMYQMDPFQLPEREIVMRGKNPIRGMYTAAYPNACSQYGSSNVNISPGEFYSGTQWCQVGILMNEHANQFNNIYQLEAQFIGNSWTFRARDPITNIFIFLNTVGYGPYGAYRNDDIISIPGKEGLWKVQIQVQHQPYILYVP